MSGNGTVQDALRKTLRRLVVMTVVLYMALAGFGVYFYIAVATTARRVEVTAEINRVALCALQHDLELRVAASREFLEENPEGINGITPSFIRDGIENQQRTIAVLGVVDCSV